MSAFADPEGVLLIDIFTRSSDAQEHWPIGAASARDANDQRPETEEQRDEVFEATLIWLDQRAAERLAALAGVRSISCT